MALPGVWGEEFLVNAMTFSAQFTPVITTLAGGRFAIAYTDYSRASLDGFSDYSDSAIRVQVFCGDGRPSAPVVQVNTVTSYKQDSPRIAPLADGGFVVTYSDSSTGWNSNGDDVWSEAVRMQRFSDDGSKNGAEILVNTSVLGSQDYPSVALLENGQFIVGWDDGFRDSDVNINAQLFNADGSFASEEFMVNDGTSGLQVGSDIAGLAGGGYVVTWVDATGPDGDVGTIMARVFGANGVPVAPEFQVNTAGTSDQFQPSVTALAGGGFFIAWTDNSRGVDTGGDDTSHYAIRGQLFDAAGTPAGTEFRVNLVTTYGQSQPDVLALADGRFVVAFSDTSSGLETGGDDTEFGAIRARIFHADGSPDGDEFLVNATTTGHQNEPQMTQLPDGRVVFAWSDYSYGVETGGDDASNGAIRARILDLRETAVDWIGSAGDDDFTGTRWSDKLVGGGGHDTLTGDDGDDRLVGKGGDDALFGGVGSDIIKGNSGRDTLWADDGTDTLLGGRGDDALHGGDGADRIRGNEGCDILFGDRGEDLLVGGSQDDILLGGNGKDQIEGGRGRDELIGGFGADLLAGGSGADTFVFIAADDSRTGTRKRDIISDFEDGIDHLDLADIDANAATEHNDPLRFLGQESFTGAPGEIRYATFSNRTIVAVDLDGDRSADMKIQLTDWHDLDLGDFIL